MQNLKTLSNEALHKMTQTLVAEERKLTTSILWHMHEIQSRRLHSEMGYGSLFEYAVKGLGYSDAAAGRRIAAMRMLVAVPEVEPALEKGAISLSTLCTLQHFFQRKETPTTQEEKRELTLALQGKSRRECEKELAALDPKAAIPSEKERVISSTQTEIRFVADDSLMEKLQKIRELDAHVLGAQASYQELFHRMADLVLKKLDPSQKSSKIKTASQKETSVVSSPQSAFTPAHAHAHGISDPDPKAATIPAVIQHPASASTRAPVSTPPEAQTANPRYIPAAIRRAVWNRDQGKCAYVSPEGRKCNASYALQIDHKIPVALGGQSTLANLRLLCRSHNLHQAVALLGRKKMSSYVI